MSSNENFTPQSPNGKKPYRTTEQILRDADRIRRRIRRALDENAEFKTRWLNKNAAKNAALLAVGNATDGGRFADSDEVRAFGLTVAYAVIEAVLNEQSTLPECFTLDDVVLASNVLANEMSRGVG